MSGQSSKGINDARCRSIGDIEAFFYLSVCAGLPFCDEEKYLDVMNRKVARGKCAHDLKSSGQSA